MVKAVYPGTFDPVTNGHIDIIRRAANVVDSLVIVVSVNSGKNPVFSMEERMACGIGACLGCVCKSKEIDAHSLVHNKRVCKDGPVFLSTEVDL